MRLFVRRVWYVLRRRRLEADLDEELDFHREMTQQRLEAHGVPAADAAIAARRALGNVAAVREAAREVWLWPWLQDAAQDLRFSVRQVRRSPQLASARNPVAVVVSESLARALSLGAQDVGQRFSLADGTAVQIIGVVSDTSSVRPGERDEAMLYQSQGAANLATASVLMRVTGNPQTLISMIRTEVRALDPQLFVSPETVAATIARESERYAAVVKLTAIPAGVAVFLSLVGIYGVTAFAAGQRRHEVGIRSALGARPQEIVGLFFLSLRWPLLAGLSLGILLSAVGNRLLQQAKLVTGATLADPWVYASALLMVMCAAGATLVPALRAARGEPWLVLRDD